MVFIGLIAGTVARALVPGPDPMGVIATAALGVVGSFIGGFIGSLFSDAKISDINTAGVFLSTIGAVIALLIWKTMRRGNKAGGHAEVQTPKM
jgi:uncharacterized membrane protein YeaQ/YmgE (transglycosylase-associated protein family)